MEDAESTAESVTGRAEVRMRLVQRLDEAGLVKAKGMSAEAHGKMIDRLVDHLSYLAPVNLDILADHMISHAADATGPAKGCWPAEVLTRSWAHALQTMPPKRAPIVASWLRSVEGPTAEAGGYLVELYRHLIRHPVPVLAWTLTNIRGEAAENNRRIGLIQDRIERGTVQAVDRAWLEAYRADEREARDLIDQGRILRQSKSAESAA